MARTTQFDKAECKRVASAAESLLKIWAADNGLHVEVRGGTYADSSYSMKVEWSVVSEDGVINTRAMLDWKRYAAMYDLDPEWLGAEFMSRGISFTVCGFSPRSRKYPVLAKRADGKTFKFTPVALKRHFAAPGIDETVTVLAKKLGLAARKPAKKSRKKILIVGKSSIGATASDAIRQGMSNAEALEIVLQAHPNANTKLASINWYRNKLRKEGVKGV